MFSRDPELALQFYREDVADEALYAPAPANLGLHEALGRLVARLRRTLDAWRAARPAA